MAKAKVGRPRNEKVHSRSVASLTELCAGYSTQAFANLKRLAEGGFERVRLEYEMRLVIPPEGTVGPDGLPLQPYEIEVPLGRKVEWAEPDRAANIYLIDRVHGKPRQAVELTGKDGQPIEIDATVRDEAARELETWRREMIEKLRQSSLPSPPPTMPTSSTPTG